MGKALSGRARSKDVDLDFEVLDIETHGLIGKYIGGAASKGNDILLFKNIHDLLRYALSCRNIYAHNGGGFDFSHLLKSFMEVGLCDTYDIEPIKSGERIIAIRFFLLDENKKRVDPKKPNSTWIDSYAQIPSSLSRITKAFSPDFAKLVGTINFEGGEIFTWDNQQHIEYLKRDVIGLKMALIKFKELMFEKFGINTAFSAGGNAIKAFRVHLYEKSKRDQIKYKYFRLNPHAEKFMRLGYFGGYVYPGNKAIKRVNVKKYDYKAAYGARMKNNKFPVGNPIYSIRFKPDYQGIWKIKIKAPDNQIIAMIPVRTEKGLYYLPSGKIAETYMITELVNYYLSKNYEIEILEGYYFEKSEYIFADFMAMCEEIELLGGVYKEIAKLIRNSLYGKFGSKTIIQRIFFSHEDTNATPVIDPQKGEIIPHLFTSYEEVDADYILPHLAAYITGFQRLALAELYDRIGHENVYYTDTDSVVVPDTLPQELFNMGGRYGNMTIEDSYSVFLSLGPKHYYFIKEDGKMGSKIKGVPSKNRYPSTILGEDKIITREELVQMKLDNPTEEILVHFESATSASTMFKHLGNEKLGSLRKRTISFNTSEAWAITEDFSIIAKELKTGT